MILLPDIDGPHQTAMMRRLIMVFAVRICPETRFRMTRPRSDRRHKMFNNCLREKLFSLLSIRTEV